MFSYLFAIVITTNRPTSFLDNKSFLPSVNSTIVLIGISLLKVCPISQIITL
ncbi:hypothetical protein HNP99_003241 [Flavobacterium sp. 28A]|nr:hypothetical protein [Flavobacterium sp. 28A]